MLYKFPIISFKEFFLNSPIILRIIPIILRIIPIKYSPIIPSIILNCLKHTFFFVIYNSIQSIVFKILYVLLVFTVIVS